MAHVISPFLQHPVALPNSKEASYKTALKKTAAWKFKYETCKGKYAAKGKEIYPQSPKGRCKTAYKWYERWRLRASTDAKKLYDKLVANARLTPELKEELESAIKGVVTISKQAGFIPSTDADMQAADAEEAAVDAAEEGGVPATVGDSGGGSNTMLYVGAAVGVLALGAGAYFLFIRK